MIKPSDCVLVGKAIKAHGLGGELSVQFFSGEFADSIEPGSCLIFEMDGIPTPFFVRTARPRGPQALLLAFDGISDQEGAQALAGKSVSAIADCQDYADDDQAGDDEGLYAGQLIGYQAIDADSGQAIGQIVDIDDSTANVLFVVERNDGSACSIPAAADFVASISRQSRCISFSLPLGLLEL